VRRLAAVDTQGPDLRRREASRRARERAWPAALAQLADALEAGIAFPAAVTLVAEGRPRDEQTHAFTPHSVNVLTLRVAEIEEITAFLTPDAFPHFGLPNRIPA
jgi:hypothetical protein